MDRTGSLQAGGAPEAPLARGPVPGDDALAALRRARFAVSAAQADEMRCVARLVEQSRAETLERVAELAARSEAPTRCSLGDGEIPVESLTDSVAVDAVSCALGVSRSAAAELMALAERLTTVLPEVLDAWSEGVLDGARVRVLSRATEVLDDDTARAVTRDVLPSTGPTPWDGPAPRTWRTRVERAVVRADVDAAARRRAAALTARRVRAWADADGTGLLQWHADVAEIALADQVITDLAHAQPRVGADGLPRPMDQRRSDALSQLFRRVRDQSLTAFPDTAFPDTAGSPAPASGPSASDHAADGPALPRVPVRRVHDIGLVLHADTLFGDGPAARETAQQRVLGAPAVLDPASARTLARHRLDQGDSVQVALVDRAGALQRVVRLDRGAARGACRSPEALRAAVREALREAPALETDAYHPTESIARHVRADAPTCSFYDCGRRARSCDLDHDTPWPRGPTSVTNLDPKCRRHHNTKTAGVVRTMVNAGPGAGTRHVTWVLPLGIRVTTTPEPLPGCRL
jgi:hypothetical protein